MKTHKEEIKILRDHLENLNLDVHSTQGIGDCPFCLKPDHFYINKFNFLWDCKKCGEEGNLLKLVKHLGIENKFADINVKKYLLDSVPILDIQVGNSDSVELKEIEELIHFEEHFTPVEVGDKYYKYLRSRGFSKDYILLNKNLFCKESETQGFKDYLILPVIQDSKILGFVGRLIWSNEKIDSYNHNIELKFAGNEKLIKKLSKRRYSNSYETEFSELLYGIDDVKSHHTVIITEGIFDKLSVDRFIDRYNLNHKYSCVCTFGKKMAKRQIKLLKNKNVNSILFLWDFDALRSMQNNHETYEKSFRKIEVCFITQKDDKGEVLDAGASKPKIIKNAIRQRISFSSFMTDVVDVDLF